MRRPKPDGRRPAHPHPRHQTPSSANSSAPTLKSESPNTAPWLLKQEMRRAGSRLIALADATAVPAGHPLAVDSRRVLAPHRRKPSPQSRASESYRDEVTSLDTDDNTLTIVASGPLTSDALSREIAQLTVQTIWRFTTPSPPSSTLKPST